MNDRMPPLTPPGQIAARRSTAELGDWVATLTWQDVPAQVRERLALVLLDSLGVMATGARQTDQRALVAAWDAGPGPAPLVGAGTSAPVEAAAWLNATALVSLELDEGHKYAKGHPAAHALPAVLALASATHASGEETLLALLAAYEVAARFGRATRLRPGAHPHGSWGVPGAAAGCARILGLDGAWTAAAIDAGAGLPVAGHFSTALDGNPVRNAWMGAANVSGLAAARLAKAGVGQCTGTAAGSLGQLLGEFAPQGLTEQLGSRWEIELGYFKRHAACSFTHPAADAVLMLRDQVGEVAQVEEVLVETHSLGAGLTRTRWDTQLSALFSTPFVVASALLHGAVLPSASETVGRQDPAVTALAQRVTVQVAPDLDARLPRERVARVTVRAAGREFTAEVPNPVGDADHQPLDEAQVLDLLRSLLDDDAVNTLHEVVTALPTTPDAAPLLARLAEV